MHNRNNDIERYLRGKMTPSEMHALENEALNDPFLADALQGAQSVDSDDFSVDVEYLKSSIASRSSKRKPRILSMWNWSIGIAAALMLIGVAGVFLVSRIPQKEAPIAMNENADLSVFGATSKDTIEIMMPRVRVITIPAHVRQIQRVRGQARGLRHEEREVEVNLTDPATLQIESDNQSVQSNTTPNTSLTLNPRLIKGTVTSSEDGSVLPGVNVLVKGTTVGTVTDAEGKYEIMLTQPDQKLEFTFIGVKTVVAETRNKTNVNVSLVPDYESLSEIVVTGAQVNEANHPTYNLAQPQGGRDAFSQYLEKKLVYPEQALKNEVEGRVTIQFTVDANGQLSNFKVINSLGFGCDDEAIRLIREGPAWSPSKKNDKAVAEEVKVGLQFNIPDKKD